MLAGSVLAGVALPVRAAPLCARFRLSCSSTSPCRDAADLVGPHGFERAAAERSSRGSGGAPRLDRPRRRARRRRGGALDRADATASPSTRTSSSTARSARLLRLGGPPRRPRGDAGDDRPARPATCSAADGTPCAARVRARPTARSRRTASRGRARRALGADALARRRPAASLATRRRPLPARHVVGAGGHVHAPALPRGRARVALAERPGAVRRADRPWSRRAAAQVVGRVRHRPRPDDAGAARAARGRRTATCVVRFDGSPTAYRRGDGGENPTRASSAPTSTRFDYAAVRIAFDVSPLSHPRTGSATTSAARSPGSPRRPAGEHEIVAFAPTSPRGPKAIRAALAGHPRRARARPFLPFAHCWRDGWSRLGRPAVERFLGPFDVLHFTDWMYPPQRAGSARRRSTTSCRCASRSG